MVTQGALEDTLAGVALGMGVLVPMVSYSNKLADPTMKLLIQDLVLYLINRGQ